MDPLSLWRPVLAAIVLTSIGCIDRAPSSPPEVPSTAQITPPTPSPDILGTPPEESLPLGIALFVDLPGTTTMEGRVGQTFNVTVQLAVPADRPLDDVYVETNFSDSLQHIAGDLTYLGRVVGTPNVTRITFMPTRPGLAEVNVTAHVHLQGTMVGSSQDLLILVEEASRRRG